MSERDFVVQSQSGPYAVEFPDEGVTDIRTGAGRVVVIDRRVHELYGQRFNPPMSSDDVIIVDATEETKSLEILPNFVEQLVSRGVRRSDEIIAVGGGITQDIVAFLATIMFRGMKWSFIPTTLLAQSDSCIGSKSSINAAGTKNLVGTFRAPTRVTIDTSFLRTLSDTDIRSGIGEMLKVHAISSPADFDLLAGQYETLFTDDAVMRNAIHRSLLMKRSLIELDEFDRGVRNVMNYGHSFGHAIEIATDYAIPHGIAVTIGMDMANFVAVELGHSGVDQFERMHPILSRNSIGYADVPIPLERLMGALARDKKNTATHLRLVLPNDEGRIGLVDVSSGNALEKAVAEHLKSPRCA